MNKAKHSHADIQYTMLLLYNNFILLNVNHQFKQFFSIKVWNQIFASYQATHRMKAETAREGFLFGGPT